MAERLTVDQEVVGSTPISLPNSNSLLDYLNILKTNKNNLLHCIMNNQLNTIEFIMYTKYV